MKADHHTPSHRKWAGGLTMGKEVKSMNRNLRRRATRTTGPRGGVKVTASRPVVGPRGGVTRVTRTRDGRGRSRGSKRVYLGAS